MRGPFLIFCSLEVSGLPYQMAETLQHHGVQCYYISIARRPHGHDSTLYQLGPRSHANWDLSPAMQGLTWREKVDALKRLDQRYGFAGILATGDLSYLLAEAGLSYAYYCFGVDLDQLDFRRSWTAHLPWWRKWIYRLYFFLAVRRRMLRTLAGASRYMLVPYQREILERYVAKPLGFFFPHILPTPPWDDLLQERERARQRLRERFGGETFVFSAVRHFWSGVRRDLHEDKANHLGLEGFAHCLHLRPDSGLRLITVEAGPDVAASRDLCRLLNIEDRLIWVPHCSRLQLQDYYLGASATLGNFGQPLISFGVLEPISLGCPCISRLHPYGGVATYSPLPPLLHADNPQQVAAQLVSLLAQPDVWSARSYEGWLWSREQMSESRFVTCFPQMFRADDAIIHRPPDNA